MRMLLFLLLACLAAAAGCNIMPEEDPGYNVRIEADSVTRSEKS